MCAFPAGPDCAVRLVVGRGRHECQTTRAPSTGLSRLRYAPRSLYDTRRSRSVSMLQDKVFKAVGRPLPRKEDLRLITGKGRFTDDFNLPRQAWAAMVRSTHPHARIGATDAST